MPEQLRPEPLISAKPPPPFLISHFSFLIGADTIPKQKKHSFRSALLGALGGIRTPDTRFRKPPLYPAELQTHESFLL